MRGSDPAGGGGLRAYLRALLTSALIATGIIAGFNLVMDPMGEFGISGTHRLNAVVPMEVHQFRMGAVDRYLSTVIDGRADRYLIAQMFPRMIAALLVTLAALLIERLLRLLDLITGHGADIGPVFTLMLNLLPKPRKLKLNQHPLKADLTGV